MHNQNKIILLGAARSGTKMLRDVIATHPLIAKVPYDVNFVWKYGNENIDHDLIRTNQIKIDSQVFIDSYFNKFQKKSKYLIEKTVSNTIRIPYVLALYPNAKYIYLTRDGRDVVESVNRQWGVSPPISYLWNKLKSFPLLHALSYGLKYGIDLVRIRIINKPTSTYIWGVKYPGYDKDIAESNVLEFCAKQWVKCIQSSEQYKGLIPSANLYEIRYEAFVANPILHLKKISAFLDIEDIYDAAMVSEINTKNIGKGFAKLSENERHNVLRIIQTQLDKLNYN